MYRVLVFASLNKYIEKPFDREGSEKRISENNSRYPDVFFVISALPGIEMLEPGEINHLQSN